MNYLIIGGVAAGTKTAAKLKRMDRNATVTILTKDKDISYAGCALPYYVGGLVEDRSTLIVNTPAKYEGLTGVTVHTGKEAVSLHSEKKVVDAVDLATGAAAAYPYDVCVIATGASAIVPNMDGTSLPGVFPLRTPDDAVAIRAFVKEHSVKNAVVAGGGFIGLEAAENLLGVGIGVTVVDLAPQILPNVFDPEMAQYIKKHLQKNGVRIYTNTKIESIQGTDRVTGVHTDHGTIPAELVILSVGIRPNTAFLKDSGIAMDRGTIITDEKLRTNLPDVYAVGDCALVKNRITGAAQWSAMGSSANYEGRTLAEILGGRDKTYLGVLGTGIVKLPALNAARTGLTEAQASAAGYDVATALSVSDDKAHYYPGAATFITKLVTDKSTHRLLGAQVLGPGAVDKMIDIAVTGITLGASLEDLENMDLAYAPPFSTAIHPFVEAVNILLNKLSGDLISMTPADYAAGKASDYKVIDAGQVPTLPGAAHVDLTTVTGPVEGLKRDEKLLLVCSKGKRAYFLQNRLRHFGYTNTAVLEGASFFNDVRVPGANSSLTPEDIARVKALGFLRDKRTPDRFNARVITRNGKITAQENRAITEAAEQFGNGEITLTSRLTVEIQGVAYSDIEPLRDFLAQAGLETGGTGSKVRPVVSCKGTTCQYGLADTFSLSEEIHERFYHGYGSVKLPHKFKIAVGGCPNNCVKPDLNDLGVIGQSVPEIEPDKCRGCKACQVVTACPIAAARVDGGKIIIDQDVCNHCGRCVAKCPFGAVDNARKGYRIAIGGRWGKQTKQGRLLHEIFTDREQVFDTIEKAILLFREQGQTGERFADTIDRIGFEEVENQLMADDLLKRKQENIAAAKHLKGGATC